MKKIIGLVLISLGLVIMVGCQSKVTEELNDLPIGEDKPALVTEKISEKDSGETIDLESVDFDYTTLPSIELIDVSGGNATGTAYYGFVEGIGTRQRVIGYNMPALNNGEFFEGWLVRGDQFFSTGKMVKSDDTYVLNYINDLDDTPFRKIVITLEPDDGNDAPAAHVIENAFSDERNLKF